MDGLLPLSLDNFARDDFLAQARSPEALLAKPGLNSEARRTPLSLLKTEFKTRLSRRDSSREVLLLRVVRS